MLGLGFIVDLPLAVFPLFFFFNDTATTEIYTLSDTLSLHDALPICAAGCRRASPPRSVPRRWRSRSEEHTSELQSPLNISYAVFCLKKKKQHHNLHLHALDRIISDQRNSPRKN